MKYNIFLIMALLTGQLAVGQSAKEVAIKCLPATVSLIMEDSYRQPISLGSGFIIAKGKIITNMHVIEGARHGYAILNGNSVKYPIEGYVAIDNKNDLVILSTPNIDVPPLSLSEGELPTIGERIYAIGNPRGLTGTISEGIVSGIRSSEDITLIQITAPISPGSSGGPVVNDQGKVIGLAVGTLSSGQNLNFAIPASTIESLKSKQSINVIPLNITKEDISFNTIKDGAHVIDGIKVRNVIFETSVSALYDYPKILKSISLKNDLAYFVGDIRILFIVYDDTGVPLDYFEEKYNRYHYGIKPFLARTIDFGSAGYEHKALRLENKSERIEIRILDFTIDED